VELRLSQAEIDALLAAVQSESAGSRKRESRIAETYDFRVSRGTDSEQFSIIKELLQSFGRDLGISAGDFLRARSAAKVVSVEQGVYREFLGSVPETAYLASFTMVPAGVCFLLQADYSVVFSIIDLILGGPGAGIEQVRSLTRIEEEVFRPILNIVCTSLKKAFSESSRVDVRSDGGRKKNELASLLPSTETIVVVNCEVSFGEARGDFRFLFPVIGFDSLIHGATSQLRPEKRLPSAEFRQRIQERLLEARFAAQLVLPSSLMKVRDLLILEPGRILSLPKRAQDPGALEIVGKTAFAAYPVRLGKQRGARIEKHFSLGAERKEIK
jgi:flagellar motor switch protein FliM